MRVGIGYDVHKLVENRKLILGGVELEYDRGLLGHSDADVLTHAIMDALLGALALGDIGKLFPDSDSKFKDADSIDLLKAVFSRVKEKGYQLGNIDSIVMAQKPKISPYIESIRSTLASALECSQDQISVKATTTEKLGFIGQGKGIAAQAIVLLQSK